MPILDTIAQKLYGRDPAPPPTNRESLYLDHTPEFCEKQIHFYRKKLFNIVFVTTLIVQFATLILGGFIGGPGFILFGLFLCAAAGTAAGGGCYYMESLWWKEKHRSEGFANLIQHCRNGTIGKVINDAKNFSPKDDIVTRMAADLGYNPQTTLDLAQCAIGYVAQREKQRSCAR